MSAKDYKFCEKVGPGGHKCSCCADKNIKRRNNRKVRRVGKRELKKEQM